MKSLNLIIVSVITFSGNLLGQTFIKVTTDVVVNGGGSLSNAWGDYDNDRFVDLFLAEGSNNTSKLYKNNRDGSFIKIIIGPIISEKRGISGSWGDYDNDGDLDIFIAAGGNVGNVDNFLYSNNGDGTFTRITTGVIVNDGGASISGSWGDYDNDGDLDLFVANRGLNENFLYSNNGNAAFTKITAGPIVTDVEPSLGGSWGDYDNDGDLDLFVANLGSDNFLYSNNGDGTFTKITTGEVVNDGGASIGSCWGDYDNDGDLDLFVANLGENNFLYSNNGDGTFAKVTTEVVALDMENSFGSSWADYDNDGDLDLFVSNLGAENNALYLNNRKEVKNALSNIFY